jgi:hypothetical protein
VSGGRCDHRNFRFHRVMLVGALDEWSRATTIGLIELTNTDFALLESCCLSRSGLCRRGPGLLGGTVAAFEDRYHARSGTGTVQRIKAEMSA